MEKENAGASKKDSIVKTYAIVIVMLVVAMAVRFTVSPILGFDQPFLFLWPVVFMAVWLGGLKTGMVATLLCVLSASFFFEPRFSFVATQTADQVTLAIFVLLSFALSIFVDNVTRTKSKMEKALHFSRQELMIKISVLISDAMIVTDDNAHIIHMNEAAEHLTGWQSSEALDREVSDVVRFADENETELLNRKGERIKLKEPPEPLVIDMTTPLSTVRILRKS